MEKAERESESGLRAARPSRSWVWCAWALLVLVTLLGGWEHFAASYSPRNDGPRRVHDAILGAGKDLARTLRELPPPAAPRLAVFGSSQIATVTDGDITVSLPARLSQALERRGVLHEVLDLSAGGQQVSESMVILLAAGDRAQVRAVLLGLSLFSMLRVEVRERLLEAVDVSQIRENVLAELPSDVPREDVDALLEFSRSAPQRVAGRGETIQQRIDRWLGSRLESSLAAVANRRVLFDELVDAPLRRDLVAFVKRNLTGARTARTFRIGSSYGPSLAALEVMARWCKARGVTFHVALLPFDHERPPAPFDAETVTRLQDDLAALSAKHGFPVTDHSELLSSSNFGNHVDGSPDHLHFDARGHERLARELADVVRADLEPALAVHPAR